MTAQARQLKQQLRSALIAARQWRGDTALTLPLYWRRSTISPVFFGRYPRSSLHSLALSPPPPRPPTNPHVPVPNKQPRFCGRKATWSRSPPSSGRLTRWHPSSNKCCRVSVLLAEVSLYIHRNRRLTRDGESRTGVHLGFRHTACSWALLPGLRHPSRPKHCHNCMITL